MPEETDRLPIVDEASALQEDSITALRAALPTRLFRFREEGRVDFGVDGWIEAIDRGRATNARAAIQLKSTGTGSPNNDGSYSLQVSVKNLNYLSRSSTPIYVYYIHAATELRYVYAHDFIGELDQRNPAWRAQDSVTMRFERRLSEKDVIALHKRIVAEGNRTRSDVPAEGTFEADVVCEPEIPGPDTVVGFALRLSQCVRSCSGTCFGEFTWCRLVSESDFQLPHYVVPSVRRKDDAGRLSSQPLNTLFGQWLNDEESAHLALLGDYGVGKTSACLFLAEALSSGSIRSSKHSYLPVIVPLEVFSTRGPAGSLTRILSSQTGVSQEAIQESLSNRALVLFLDGFDEMCGTVTPDEILRKFLMLRPFYQSGCKTVLTCRTHLFATDAQVEEVLDGRVPGTDLLSLFHRDLRSSSIAEIQEFSTSQIIEVIQRRFPEEDALALWEEVRSLYDLGDLSRRAILLRLILETLPEIRRRCRVTGGAMTSADLYATYVDFCLSREAVRRTETGAGEKLRLVCRLASQMWSRNVVSIHYSRLAQSLRTALAEDFPLTSRMGQEEFGTRSASFLNRDSHGNYRFMHKSFMEYFVAQQCVAEVGAAQPQMLSWQKRWFDKQIAGFIAGSLCRSASSALVGRLLEVAGAATHKVLLWNTLHVLSLLPIERVQRTEWKAAFEGIMARTASDPNAVLLRQYCRFVAKFVSPEEGQVLIDRVIEIVLREPTQNDENTRTYVEYYHGQGSARGALLEHLAAPVAKYDRRLHIHVLGELGEMSDASRLQELAAAWTQHRCEDDVEVALSRIRARK